MAEDVLGDGRLLKRVLKAGHADAAPPRRGDKVRAHYETFLAATAARVDGSLPGQPFAFEVGAGAVLEAWQHAIPSMRPGETSEFTADASLAYGEEGAGDIPPDAALRFVITLLSDADEESPAGAETPAAAGDGERLRAAEATKARGNGLIREGRFAEAREAYLEGLRALRGCRGEDFEHLRTKNELRHSCLLNLAHAELKLDDFSSSAAHASEVLEADPGNCKALYRRGTARLGCGRVAEALEDFRAALRLEPNSGELRARLQECKDKLAESDQWHKIAFGGMFGKVSEQRLIKHSLDNLPKVWLEIQIGDRQSRRLQAALYHDVAPRAAANFRALCTGERGVGRCGQPLHFKNTLVHRIVPKCLIEAGDVVHYDGSGGESIYGGDFADESFAETHHRRGLLSMANRGPNTNNSKFFITLRSLPQFDRRHVVFGELIGDTSLLEEMEEVETEYPDKPVTQVAIVDCGVFTD